MHPDPKLKNIRIAGLGLIAFFLMFAYSILRPAAESLFLETHTSKGLPLAWILVALGMTVVVGFYSRFVGRKDLLQLFAHVLLCSLLLLALLMGAVSAKFPGAYYALYVFKDLFMVVLVEIYYSYANSVFPIKTARWAYGFFGFLSAVGGVLGNLAIGFLAETVGTFSSLFTLFPLLILLAVFCYFFSGQAGIGTPMEDRKKVGMADAVRIINKSSYLTFVLILIAVVQIAVTLIDFSFNAALENHFPLLDVRTGMIGKVYAVVSACTIVLHILTGPILRMVTVPITLLAIPVIMTGGLGVYLAVPLFLSMALVKVSSKVFPYTLFRSSKEILYIPLHYEEKTLAKSVVDMLTYRVAKGGASLLLMGLLALGLSAYISWLTLLFILGWFSVTLVITIRFREKVTTAQEIYSEEVGR